MALQKETGIVVAAWDHGDADRVFVLAGEHRPRQKFISKGIRKSKKRPILATEIGSRIEIDYYEDPKKEWKSIKEINLLDRFETMKSSYFGILFNLYLCELTSAFLPEGEVFPYAYQLLWGTFNHYEKEGFALALLPFFKVRLISQLGLFPKEFHCVTCGENVFSKGSAFFSWEAREFLCGDCSPIPKNHIPLLRILFQMLHKRFGLLTLAPNDQELVVESDSLLNRYLRGLLEKEIKSYFEFYKKLETL